ncbi:MAG TPA: HAMP domain-containing sensor histidine kinase [Chitinophagaceae bacterium]|nr:HAMP domain-containing sensor histidine kinase [Chitinophagaceae bacterium]
MKLFTRYSRINFAATALVLLVGSLSFYVILRYVLIRQLDDTLRVEEAEIQDFVSKRDSLPPPANYKDQHVQFVARDEPVHRRFRSRVVYDDPDGEARPFRMLTFPVRAGGRYYMATVSKSQVETEDLLFLIVVLIIGIIVLLSIFQFIINRFLIRKMWQPFQETMQAIKQFNLSGKEATRFPPTRIEEFTELNGALNQMTEKILGDYQTLKHFTDNASHEMQTPLAVINSKLDLLIQDQGLNEKQIRQLQAMYDAVGRLSRLNQSLLLMTKIENEQFLETEPVDLKELTEKKLVELEDLVQAGGLTLTASLESVRTAMNPFLADILLNNLLINAIRHNVAGGSIAVTLRAGEFRVRNTGNPLPFEEQQLFDRFQKGPRSQGVGLGLAIVRQICDHMHLVVGHEYAEGWHSFSIRF